MSEVTIYHNPNCGTSRNTLALIRDAGIEPTVVEYLRSPPSRATLKQMIADAGLTVRQALREKGAPYEELGLSNPDLSEDQLLDTMMAHPILINRPFVVTMRGTRLARPSEVVLEILPPGAGVVQKQTPVSDQSKAIDESVRESFPASDPPSSHIPDNPPVNADAKWAAAKAAEARKSKK